MMKKLNCLVAMVFLLVVGCNDGATTSTLLTYTITFHSNGGSVVASQSVERSKKVTRPQDPTYVGHSFVGWFTDTALTQSFDFAVTTVSANISLYAKWDPESTGGATKQTYTLTVKYSWTEASHGPFPNNAHFTALFIVVHNDRYFLYARGEQLSSGMESLAESGSISSVQSETNGNANVLKTYTNASNSSPTGEVILDNIEVTSEYPYISFATMIAPSPDWFVAKSRALLYETGSFVSIDTFLGLTSYDGGTEEGEGFSLSNSPTNPKQGVTVLTSMNNVPLDNANKPMASYKIVKK